MTDSANNGTQSDFAKAFRAVTPAHMREHRMRYIDDFNAFKILQAHTPHVACSTAKHPQKLARVSLPKCHEHHCHQHREEAAKDLGGQYLGQGTDAERRGSADSNKFGYFGMSFVLY